MKLFGFELLRAKENGVRDFSTPISPQIEDGAINISAAGSYGFYVDLDGSYRSELDLITKYRTMALQPEMESAIEDIINEAIVHDNQSKTVSIILDELKEPDKIKDMIRSEFDNILRMLDFGNFGSEIFKRWYVDGKIYYHVIIDDKDPRQGIKDLMYIDPRRIRKIRNVVKKKNAQGIEVIDRIDEFYLYNEKIINNNTQQPQLTGSMSNSIRLSKDSIVLITSGVYDPTKSTVLSYLHKAIRPMNQLRFVEDAIVIYRLSRAPERRVFYVDVGNMPRLKAEQYIKNMMTMFRSKLLYDSNTGEVRDDRRHLSMMEDFWIPRQGERNTEIQTLPAGQNLGELEDVKYFQNKLYRSLNVPFSRMESSQGFTLGKSTEITRDEIKFMKFINRLRDRFTLLFDELLARQLSLKGICTVDEWNEFKNYIHYDFLKDNNFAELKDAELLGNRLNLLSQVDAFVGRYFSKIWVQKNVLRFDEQQIKDIEQEMQIDLLLQQQQEMQQQNQDGSDEPDADQEESEDGVDDSGKSTRSRGKKNKEKSGKPEDSDDINRRIQEIL